MDLSLEVRTLQRINSDNETLFELVQNKIRVSVERAENGIRKVSISRKLCEATIDSKLLVSTQPVVYEVVVEGNHPKVIVLIVRLLGKKGIWEPVTGETALH